MTFAIDNAGHEIKITHTQQTAHFQPVEVRQEDKNHFESLLNTKPKLEQNPTRPVLEAISRGIVQLRVSYDKKMEKIEKTALTTTFPANVLRSSRATGIAWQTLILVHPISIMDRSVKNYLRE